MDERDLVKKLMDFNSADLMHLCGMRHEDAWQLMCYLSRGGALTQKEGEDNEHAVLAVLDDPNWIPFAKCIFVAEQLDRQTACTWQQIAENREGYTAKNDQDSAVCQRLCALSLIEMKNGAWYNRIPMPCVYLTVNTALYYTEHAWRYRVLEPILYSMTQSDDLPDTVLRSPMLPRQYRCLARKLLEDYRADGIDLSLKAYAGQMDVREKWAYDVLNSAFAEFDLSTAEQYRDAILPYCRNLLASPHLPQAFKESIHMALEELGTLGEKAIVSRRQVARFRHLPPELVPEDLWDDALF